MRSFTKLSSISFLALSYATVIMLEGLLLVEARDKGDDIILSKGKIIMRGGKNKGNIILDPGSGSSHTVMMPPMMPMMSHFNPYHFYPQHQHQHQPQPMVIHPVYLEDHSAMHQQHHVEPQHMYHHEEPHYQHHEMESHQHHHGGYEPQHHHHHEEEEHHEPQHYEHEHEHEGAGGAGEHHGHEDEHHHEVGGGGGGEHYEGHPLMSMMMHGSGLQPQAIQQQHQQMTAMQAFQQPGIFVQHPNQQAVEQEMAYRQLAAAQLAEQAALQNDGQQDQMVSGPGNNGQKDSSSAAASSSTSSASHSASSGDTSSQPSAQSSVTAKPFAALLEKSANNPLVQMIKPLFKRNKDASSTTVAPKKP